MKKSILFVLCCLLLMFNSACDDSGSKKDSSPSGGGDSTINTDDPDDLVENTTFDYTITINFTAHTAQLSSGAAQTITTAGVTVLDDGGETVTVTQTDYGITVESTVSEEVKYVLIGTYTGTLTVESDQLYQLNLSNVTINAADGPALDLESSEKAFIVLAAGSSNTLADDGTGAATMDKKGTLYGKGPLVFSGTGSLDVTGNYEHGIYSKDYIRICEGTLNVTVNTRDGVRSKNGFIFDDGDLTITGNGTVTDEESKGIKVDGDDEDADGPGRGYIVINGGEMDITTVGKAITAAWEIEDAETATTTDDPDPDVVINGGIINITTTGASSDDLSPEGIEGKSDLIINEGYITINTTDDCLNAGESIEINGGSIYCRSSSNDAIDSNGTLTISGGVLVAIGSNGVEGAFDCDRNTFSITGGTFVGIGGTVSEPTCSQNTVMLGSLGSGTTMALRTSDGTTVFAYTIPSSYSYTTMLLSCQDIDKGTQYSVYTGGTASADDEFEGLYLENINYSGGSVVSGMTFTVTSSFTNQGGTIF